MTDGRGLRKGNLVKITSFPDGSPTGEIHHSIVKNGYYYGVVEEIHEDVLVIYEEGYKVSVPFKNVEPIPLTEDWLVKFGFVKTIGKLETIYNLEMFEYATSCKTIDLEFGECDSSVSYATDIEYIHELQNLYFALTGKELEIKE